MAATRNPATRYERKISKEEATEQYVLVEKRCLSFFPASPATFSLKVGGKVKKARVEAYPCTCRGPELPHEHYFVRCSGLTVGGRAVFTRDSATRYALELR